MGKRIDITAEAYVLMGLLVMLLPMGWWVAALGTALLHEACHALAVRLLGGRIEGIRVDLGGIRMDTTPLPPGGRLIAALAGPIGGLLPVLAAKHFPRLAACALLQSAFNLLPLFPLDGGRAVQAALALFLSEETAERVSRWVGNGTMMMFLVLGILQLIRFGSKFLLFAAGVLLFRWFRGRKISCKEVQLRVQ